MNSGNFYIKTGTIDNVSVPTNNSNSVTITGINPASGYTRVVLCVETNNASTNGTMYSWCYVYNCSYESNGIKCFIKNTATGGAAKIKIKVTCAYFLTSSFK